MKLKKQCKGFTLVEIMVALNIIAVGMVFLFYAHKLNIKHISTASTNYQASLFLKEKIEEISVLNLSNISLSGKQKIDQTNFNWETTVYPYNKSLNKITISVSYKEDTIAKEKSITSII